MQPNASGVWGLLLALQALCAFLISAQTQPTPLELRLTLTNSDALLRWTSELNERLRIDAAEKLPEWEPLMTLRTGAGVNQAIDAGAPYLTKRFYRAERLTDTAAFTGDHVPTTNGLLTIQPIYHATFAMKWNEKYIYNDPAAPAVVTGMPKADLILISHAHGDHYDVTRINTLWKSNTVIIASRTAYTNLRASGTTSQFFRNTILLTNGASTNVLGMEIEAVPAYNANHPQGDGNGYVVTIGGKRLYMAGDTGDTPEMKALQNIDAAFLPMNIPYTMNITNAANAVRAFKPRIVYPYHFRNMNGSYAATNAFKAMVGQDLGIEVRLRKWY